VDTKFERVIACPDCLRAGEFTPSGFSCVACDRTYRVIDGVPVFVDDLRTYVDRRQVREATNPYPPRVLELLQRHADAMILDFGAGHPAKEHEFAHVLRHDFAQYDNTDVVSTKANLPYTGDSFDFVISMSVFEHVADPWHYASEIHRVVRPGGTIMIDVAFLQPLHGDPYHFYNMTERGLKHAFRMFRHIECGAAPYQSAGMTMNILKLRFLDLVEDDEARRFIRSRVGDIDYCTFDRYIPEHRKMEMSAGVYLIAEK
jgi:SAM-dependent methyltransferase